MRRKQAQRTTSERGYGRQHQRERQRYAPAITAGQGYCTERVCVMPTRWIAPGSPWDLAHGNTRHEYRGPAHRRCNRSEGATRGNRMRARLTTTAKRLPTW